MFSSRSFTVSDLMFTSLIHFEFFVYKVNSSDEHIFTEPVLMPDVFGKKASVCHFGLGCECVENCLIQSPLSSAWAWRASP